MQNGMELEKLEAAEQIEVTVVIQGGVNKSLHV